MSRNFTVTPMEDPFRILTVDDEETILHLYYQILSSSRDLAGDAEEVPHFEVSQSRQGDQAVAMVQEGRENGRPFSVVFLDINMPPGPDGIWTARKIREIDADVGIVLVTGQVRVNILETARTVLPVDKLLYLQKPFYPQEILQFASALSEKWRVEREYRSIMQDLEERVQARTVSLMEANKRLSEEIETRTRIQTALKESEKKFREMITNNSDGIVILDQNNTIRFLNPAAEALFSVHGTELLGCLFEYPVSLEKTTEIEIKNRNRASVVAEMQVVETEWEGKKALLASIRDISERKRMEVDVAQSYDKLQKAMVGIIEAMANIVERRDPYTSGHQQRVARLCRAIALEMNLSEDKVEGIYMAAFIHDIGKIVVPAEILSKPGKLSEMEFELIKIHPQAGHDILKGIEFPWPIAEVTFQHHERMDGSGYPRGLTGDRILLEARIMAVADTVEAMATHRPYRPALGIDEALNEVMQNAGHKYDAGVVEACRRVFSERGFQL